MWAWLDERLGISSLHAKYGRKVFPVHSSFFLGEMALFAFIVLVVTGVYLGLMYAPSNVEVPVTAVGAQVPAGPGGNVPDTVPEAYASVLLIESIPVANLFRNVHHWAAHVMVACILLHAMRVFFTGTYRKPREPNWVIGVVLLGLSIVAGFVGYALPYDSYAVTATGIGYSIARSIPYAGELASELFFGGAFPTLGSLPRLYTLHVVVIPAAITALMGLHLLIVLKQKHTQPGYARRIAEPGRVLGVPMWPYQALLAGQLLLLLFGGLFLLSAFVPVHPLAAYGPPGPFTPDVKPDWYLLWVYGLLKLLPPEAAIDLPGGVRLEPDFLGGILLPALVFALVTFAPWLDVTNRGGRRFEYMEPVSQAPLRLGLGGALLVLVGLFVVAAYAGELGLELIQYWFVIMALVPLTMFVLYAGARYVRRDAAPFDPTGELTAPDEDAAAPPARAASPSDPRAGSPPTASPAAQSPAPVPFADWLADRMAERRDVTTMELAAEVGVLDGDVEDWLAGRATPNADECRALADYLGVPPDEVHSRCGPESGGRGDHGHAARNGRIDGPGMP